MNHRRFEFKGTDDAIPEQFYPETPDQGKFYSAAFSENSSRRRARDSGNSASREM